MITFMSVCGLSFSLAQSNLHPLDGPSLILSHPNYFSPFSWNCSVYQWAIKSDDEEEDEDEDEEDEEEDEW